MTALPRLAALCKLVIMQSRAWLESTTTLTAIKGSFTSYRWWNCPIIDMKAIQMIPSDKNHQIYLSCSNFIVIHFKWFWSPNQIWAAGDCHLCYNWLSGILQLPNELWYGTHWHGLYSMLRQLSPMPMGTQWNRQKHRGGKTHNWIRNH